MKVRTMVVVDEHARLVIAKFFAASAPAGEPDVARTRATRKQVRRFVAHAVRSAVKEHAMLLRGRARAATQRLAAAADVAPPPLPEPREKQLMLY